jgi:hypothetical protein
LVEDVHRLERAVEVCLELVEDVLREPALRLSFLRSS